MDKSFCVRALKQAMTSTGRKPKIFNTDQGSQFSSEQWTTELKTQGFQISMDGKGCWMDKVFIERLWRSIKYEKLRLWSYNTIGGTAGTRLRLDGVLQPSLQTLGHPFHLSSYGEQTENQVLS